MRYLFTKSTFGLLFFALFFNYCKKPTEIVVHINKEEFTIEDQQLIGEHLSAIIESSTAYYEVLKTEESPEFYTYINRLLSTLVNTNQVDNRSIFDWEVIILKDDEMRSVFTIPGGKIYVYTGLLKMLAGENELFSILAHEVYYSDKETVIDLMKEEYSTLIIGDLLLGTNSPGTIDIANTIQNMAYPSEAVAKADKFYLEVICPFQYEARGLISFIEKASSMTEEVKWLTIHPGASDRLSIIETLAQGCGEEELTFAERYEYNLSFLP
ncbi:MAG: putative Zn-dependent protease [Saprospiraceae bacterium]|jgi:predicted Zn-dependent protease